MNAVRLILFTIAPGVLAYMIGALIVAWPGGADLFPIMVPARIPHALAILAEQLWLTGCGLSLIAMAAHSVVKEWRN